MGRRNRCKRGVTVTGRCRKVCRKGTAISKSAKTCVRRRRRSHKKKSG